MKSAQKEVLKMTPIRTLIKIPYQLINCKTVRFEIEVAPILSVAWSLWPFWCLWWPLAVTDWLMGNLISCSHLGIRMRMDVDIHQTLSIILIFISHSSIPMLLNLQLLILQKLQSVTFSNMLLAWKLAHWPPAPSTANHHSSWKQVLLLPTTKTACTKLEVLSQSDMKLLN